MPLPTSRTVCDLYFIVHFIFHIANCLLCILCGVFLLYPRPTAHFLHVYLSYFTNPASWLPHWNKRLSCYISRRTLVDHRAWRDTAEWHEKETKMFNAYIGRFANKIREIFLINFHKSDSVETRATKDQMFKSVERQLQDIMEKRHYVSVAWHRFAATTRP